tara:strand:+ start:1488 stop:2894 length:1407 start_codon:yes stop_codon:yes gene_type:complete
MALLLQQKPLYRLLAAEQDIIFVIKEDTTIVADKSKVKYVAYVNVMSDSAAPVQIGVFKTTPNAAEVGIFDFSTILKNYVTPDFTGTDAGGVISNFKGAAYSNTNYHSIHTVDKSALGVNSVKWFQIDFKIEYEGADAAYPNFVAEDSSMSRSTQNYLLYNGVVDETDVLQTSGSNFGYNIDVGGYATNGSVTGGALSDAPLTQYVRITDYGTLPFFSNCIPPVEGFNSPTIDNAEVEMFNSSGVSLGTFNVAVTSSATTTLAMNKIVYIGCFPANFTGAGYADWNTHKANVDYYTVKTENASTKYGQTYRFDIICESGRGYEGIRLTWLNKHGTWDYYTFNKKSVKSLSTNRKTYTQLSGTWNEATYKLYGSSGGRKNYKVDTKEKIKMNTDYISGDESVWLEQLINSTEVYILNGYQSDLGGTLRRYVQPVTLTTSKHTRKTVANDKLIQYTFEVERTKNQRTQSV